MSSVVNPVLLTYSAGDSVLEIGLAPVPLSPRRSRCWASPPPPAAEQTGPCPRRHTRQNVALGSAARALTGPPKRGLWPSIVHRASITVLWRPGVQVQQCTGRRGGRLPHRVRRGDCGLCSCSFKPHRPVTSHSALFRTQNKVHVVKHNA